MTEPGYKKPTTAEEFLRVWYVLADADNTPQLEQWEKLFPELANTAPDVTLVRQPHFDLVMFVRFVVPGGCGDGTTVRGLDVVGATRPSAGDGFQAGGVG